jgi:alpha-L-arabinofuranosidase
MLFTGVLFAAPSLYSQNKIVINTAMAKDMINKNIYGHFAKDLGPIRMHL